ncbi:bifunctional glutamate N-acetyltransferase/amino-acid acetyltransferase ArgJ [Sphingomonas piscis]|uniref:Arginine biosynthesis bifunctional protein ArgJ n=1 Tax=Sphingomonas piscis TaxID=2714943 RepID=A0A6G7YNH5_9SPHN|nr:bifunctional glutamate N-acetyltransferase/amino-acid acetyltransferase ArgJ [Sphingomonas piscis]QIK78292.1 bifunctional glutamate N-acetyltransferase/amino-acid acetyltransferase ArgJ [Sphingomonas piscis]
MESTRECYCPQGFVASGLHAGIKHKRHDMALLATVDRQPARAAAVFTQNMFVAPPVVASRSRLAENGGQAVAVIVNSGNANAGTGEPGMRDAEAMCDAAAQALGCDPKHVLVCSTGIIGNPLPIDTILEATPKLATTLSVEGSEDAAKGILTTDSEPKEALFAGSTFTIGAMAKGCGMIAPNMATMLAFITTDADLPQADMQRVLKEAVDATFNTLNVDGATSTNDTVILLSSGKRGVANLSEFTGGLFKVCEELTLKMARDAEGMTRLVRLRVTGARDDADARVAAKNIAENNLVKCSWHGGDPYWGRLLSAAGSSGASFNVDRAFVAYGGTMVAMSGAPLPHDEAAVAEHMKGDEYEIEVHLGVGSGTAQVIGVDLGPGYIKENSKTS